MEKDIKEALEKLQEEIVEKENQIKLIKNIDWTKKVNENEWHEFCKTSLRYSNLMNKLLKNIFSNAENIKNGGNSINFTLYDFDCDLSTSFAKCIEVDISWQKKLVEPTLENMMSNIEINMKKYFEIFDNHGYWLELYNYRFPRKKMEF